MKKIYNVFAALLLVVVFQNTVKAQCISASQYGSSTSSVPGAYTITTCNFAGEFSVLTLNVAGTYTFASNVATDYLTLTAGSSSVSLGNGTTPIVVTLTASGTYNLHVADSPTCGINNTCRTTSYTLAASPGSPTIITQPSSKGGCVGSNVSFVTSATPTNCTYQWQESTGGPFTNLTNTGVYSGVTTKTLNLTGLVGTMNGYNYQCIITNSVASVTTNSANLSVINNGALPLLEDFNSSLATPTLWINNPSAQWQVMSAHGTGGSNAMTRNLYGTFSTLVDITTVKVGPATPSTAISFDYRLMNWSGYPTGGPLTLANYANDSLNVYVSNNCGSTYTLLASINAGNHIVSTSHVNKSYSLAAYAGSNLVFKFIGKKDPSGTGDYYVDVDNINISNIVANDAGISAFVNPPAGQPCYSAAEPIVVVVKNYGINTISNIPVKVLVTGAVTQTLSAIYTPTLASTATAIFTVNTLNMTTAGVYNFKAYTTFAGDPTLGNDTLLPVVTRTVVASLPLPYTQNFNASTIFPTNWINNPTDPWAVIATHGTLGSNGMTRNLFSSIVKVEADMPRLGAITPSTSISFDYRYVNYSGYPSTATSTVDLVGDSLKLMISTNCGATYSVVGLVTSANHISTTSFANKSYPLASYAGSNAIFKFLAVRTASNPTDYYIDVDNINLFNATAIDAGVSALVSPNTSTCTSAATPVVVTIKNYGVGVISNVPVTVTVAPTGQTITATYTGSIAIGATVNFTVGTVNLSTGGTFTFTSGSNIAGDGNNTNDIFIASYTTSNPVVTINGAVAICLGNSTTLTANGTANSYTWSTGSNATSIVVTPTANATYSITGTNSISCVATNTIAISVQNPTITATGTIVCGSPANATLTASSFSPSTINWFATPTSTVSLATGGSYSVTAASTTTYYAEASSTATGSLFTTLIAGNGFNGNMFDVTALSNITLNGVDWHFNSTTTSTVEVWYRIGSFVGFESSNVGWTQAFTGTVTPLGTGSLTTIPGTFAVNVPAGQTYGIYVTTNGGSGINYTNGTALGNLYASNADLQLFEGKGGGYFSVLNSPRIFNGQLRYNKQGCTSPRVPVVFTVTPSASITAVASATTICAGQTATLTANGASNYTWTPGLQTTSVIVITPTVNTTYTVLGGSGTCTGSAVQSMSVKPSPNLLVTPTSASICTTGGSATLTASGASNYTWSPANFAGSSNIPNVVVSPSVSTVYSVTSSNTVGCTSIKTVTVLIINCIGIVKNNLVAENTLVYPNPTNGLVTVLVENNTGNYTFEAFDVVGKLVYKSNLVKAESLINIGALANGLYSYKITSISTKQVIKEGKLIKE